jgi:predicted nucleic acid-binding protein
VDRIIVDTGFLVAYARSADTLHPHADRFMKSQRGALVTVSAVIMETCFFLSAHSKRQLLEWARGGSLGVVDVPLASYSDLSATIGRNASHDIDFADAALVWLAGETRISRILTVDVRDFSLFRLKGGKRFDIVEWFPA